jgi:hypothetical protein
VVTPQVTGPIKRPRSAKQIAWSRELGRTSRALKKRKQLGITEISSGGAKDPFSNENGSNENENEISTVSNEISTAENDSSANWWLFLPISFGLALLWHKCGKYKVFQIPPKFPNNPAPAVPVPKSKIISLE